MTTHRSRTRSVDSVELLEWPGQGRRRGRTPAVACCRPDGPGHAAARRPCRGREETPVIPRNVTVTKMTTFPLSRGSVWTHSGPLPSVRRDLCRRGSAHRPRFTTPRGNGARSPDPQPPYRCAGAVRLADRTEPRAPRSCSPAGTFCEAWIVSTIQRLMAPFRWVCPSQRPAATARAGGPSRGSRPAHPGR